LCKRKALRVAYDAVADNGDWWHCSVRLYYAFHTNNTRSAGFVWPSAQHGYNNNSELRDHNRDCSRLGWLAVHAHGDCMAYGSVDGNLMNCDDVLNVILDIDTYWAFKKKGKIKIPEPCE
jgi:hypothetical protein